MLSEIKDARQIEGEGFRRWFRDDEFDLIVWYEDEGADKIVGFQLCYDTNDRERALTWTAKHGYQHHKVDDGDLPYAAKMSPVLVADGAFDATHIWERFTGAATSIDADLVTFVADKVRNAPPEVTGA